MAPATAPAVAAPAKPPHEKLASVLTTFIAYDTELTAAPMAAAIGIASHGKLPSESTYFYGLLKQYVYLFRDWGLAEFCTMVSGLINRPIPGS